MDSEEAAGGGVGCDRLHNEFANDDDVVDPALNWTAVEEFAFL